jgi:TolA-binding protein
MRICTLVLVAIVLTVSMTRGELPPDFAKATRALDDGVAEVAVPILQNLVKQNLAADDRREVVERLAEALVRAKQPENAIQLLDEARLSGDTTAEFWRAQALASLNRPAEALTVYDKVAVSTSPLDAQARFGEAEMLRVLNRPDDAIAKFSLLSRDPTLGVRAELRVVDLYLDKGDTADAARLLNKLRATNPADRKERHFLRGRLELASHWPEKAIGTFESILKHPKSADHSILIAALFGIADAHLQAHTPDKGDDVLEDFIEHHAQDPDLDRIFAKLDELYRAERKPSRGELERWIRDPAEPRREFARWYLARLEIRVGHNERAAELFAGITAVKPTSPKLAPAFLDYAQLLMNERQFERAFAVLEQARGLAPAPDVLSRISFLAAQIHYAKKQFQAAASSFEQVAATPGAIRDAARFNAALGWLQVTERGGRRADYRELTQKTDAQASAELSLDAALVKAGNADPAAAQALETFIHDFPQHPRVSEAQVALAELAFHASPPRVEEARKYLAAISNPTPIAEERRDYLMIWIEDMTVGDERRVIELAKRFLQRYTVSKSAEDVRMKLAEVYYRQQDFPNAQTEFERLAEQNPNAAWTEKALYFAAESAMASMGAQSAEQALTLFDRVVRSNGELKWAARNEQAAIERKLGKNADAIVLYEEVLKGDARPAEKREALCGKADVFFEMGDTDPKNYAQARDLYEQLAGDRDGTSHWRKQALFKKGLCLEKESNRDAALATFYDVLAETADAKGAGELFWFYKAGFSAARLLEDAAKWESAAAIYRKLVAIGGARSDEARQRLDRVRLEHFLWEE